MALQYLAVAGILFRRVEHSPSGTIILSCNSIRHVGDEFRIILDAHTGALPAVDVCSVLGVLFITSWHWKCWRASGNTKLEQHQEHEQPYVTPAGYGKQQQEKITKTGTRRQINFLGEMALQYLAVAGILFRRVEKCLSCNSMRHVGDEFRIILDAHTCALPAVDVCSVPGVPIITS
ncbi:hypothetical protein CDAR_425651 [Caerostris darwini]|uniref:Uncharacterized protein n=1 Tax=Caerostris darwini TaxID=1538125 RepID=A0AAV4N0N9_9ARAC|nr:hypothetical protein CDAR_425651 [Caerostris darwini]